MNLEDIMLNEISHSKKNLQILSFYLHEVPRVVKFFETKVEWWLPETRVREDKELFNEYGVSVLQDEKHSGDWLLL